MTRLTLGVRRKAGLPALPVDASAIRPDTLCAMPVDDVMRVPLRVGKHRVELGELFDARASEPKSGGPSDSELVIRTGELLLDGLGTEMTSGLLRVNGNTGAYTGYRMAGGRLLVSGNSAAFTGSGMRGGLLHVKGNTAERAGGVKPGHQFGMRGGVLKIDGDCGMRAGDRMRRGIILVGGDSAGQCAHRMLAGTIIVNGSCGPDNGFELRHGSLILTGSRPTMLNTFANTGQHKLMFLKLLASTIKPYHRQIASLMGKTQMCTRLVGDLAAGGRGEILLLHTEDI